MANNYTQFSEKILLNNGKEMLWWKQHLDITEETRDAWDEEGRPITDEARFFYRTTEGGSDWSFNHRVKIDMETTRYCVWFSSWKNGNVDQVAKLVQLFAQEMRPDLHFTLSWADTCDKLRIGEFGGGAVIVTKDEIRYFSTFEWLSEQEKACTPSAPSEDQPTSEPAPKPTRKRGSKRT